MKILVDENIPMMSVQSLREMGHDVLDVRGTADEGKADEALWGICQRQGRLLITTDKGFSHKTVTNNIMASLLYVLDSRIVIKFISESCGQSVNFLKKNGLACWLLYGIWCKVFGEKEDNQMLIKLKKLSFLLFIVVASYISVPPSVLASEKVFSNSLGMEFVLIPSGTFIMGSPQDEPYRQKREEVQHPVTIGKPYYMQTTEVTLKQWWAITGKRFFDRRKGTADSPVARVSWYDCMRFIKKLNNRNEGVYRLPTEAEWEYACRSGSTTAYNWGEAIDCSKAMFSNKRKKSGECLDHVRSRGLAVDRPAPVKSYPPNAWGLYDMHGNVWEWCHDWYGDYPNDPVIDPHGPDSGTKKIRRGGSWFGYGYSCRSANRNYSHPASRYRTTGFRLVWSKTDDLISREGEKELFLMEEEREGGP